MKMKKTVEATTGNHDDNWEIYRLLIGHLQHCHSRLVEHYRVFLTFNSLLIPAVTALLAYIIKNKNGLENDEVILLRIAVTLICGIGFYVTCQGAGIVRRVLIDSKVRINQITRIENKMNGLLLYPFIECGEFFFQKGKTLPSCVDGINDLSLSDFGKSISAIDAYRRSSYAVYIAYTLIATFSLYPLLLQMLAAICEVIQYK